MESPLFSVIIPAYNVEKYLPECLDSILNQSFKNFEVRLVDDGSTDGTSQICDLYAKKDDRIHVIHQSNGGHVKARLAGIQAAKGEYIACVDADDWIDDHYLQYFAEAVNRFNVDVVCCGLTLAFVDHVKEMPEYFEPGYYNRKRIEQEILPYLIMGSKQQLLHPCCYAKAIRRELCIKWFSCVDSSILFGEDDACVKPCVYYSQNLTVLKECGYYYRQYGQSITGSLKPRPWDDAKLVGQHLEHVLTPGKYDIQQQIWRRTTEEVFYIVKFQFFKKDNYRTIVKEIKAFLDDPYLQRCIKNAKFSTVSKMSARKLVIQHKLLFPLYLFCRIKYRNY